MECSPSVGKKRKANTDLLSPSKRQRKTLESLWDTCQALKWQAPNAERVEKVQSLLATAEKNLGEIQGSHKLSFARCHGIIAECAFILNDIATWKKHVAELKSILGKLTRPRYQLWLLEVQAHEANFFGRYVQTIDFADKQWQAIKKKFYLERSDNPDGLQYYFGCALLALKMEKAREVFEQLAQTTSSDYLKSHCDLKLAELCKIQGLYTESLDIISKLDPKFTAQSEYVDVLDLKISIAQSQQDWKAAEKFATELYKFDSHRKKAKGILRALHQRDLGDDILVLDNTEFGNCTKYIHISEDANAVNCELKPVTTTPGSLPQLGVFVTKQIEAGEEVLMSMSTNHSTILNTESLPLEATCAGVESPNFFRIQRLLNLQKSKKHSSVEVKDGRLFATEMIPKSTKLFLPYTGELRVISRSSEFVPGSKNIVKVSLGSHS